MKLSKVVLEKRLHKLIKSLVREIDDGISSSTWTSKKSTFLRDHSVFTIRGIQHIEKVLRGKEMQIPDDSILCFLKKGCGIKEIRTLMMNGYFNIQDLPLENLSVLMKLRGFGRNSYNFVKFNLHHLKIAYYEVSIWQRSV